MNLENERKAFNEQLKVTNKTLYEFSKDFTDDDSKESLCLQWAWTAWISSANREGYKLVPVEPDQQMIYAGESAEHKGCISVAVVYKAMIGACDE